MNTLQKISFALLFLLALRAEGQLPVHTFTELISPIDSHTVSAALRLGNGDLVQAGLQARRLSSGVTVSVGGFDTGDPSIIYYRPGQGVIQRVEWDQNIVSIHDILEGPQRSLMVFGSYQADFNTGPTTLRLGQAQERGFSLQLDSTGNVLWAKSHGDTLFGYRSGAIAGTLANDTLYEVGIVNTLFSYVLKRDPNTGSGLDSILLPARTCSDIEVDPQGRMAIVGTTNNGVFPDLSLTPPATPAGYYHYIVLLDTQFKGLWGRLTPYISFDIEDQLHVSNNDLVHQALTFPGGINNPEVMLMTKYTWQGNIVRTDTLPHSSASFLYNANDVLVRGNEYFTFAYDPYTRVEVHHFDGTNWTEEGYFTGAFFLPLFMVADGPEDLWIAGTVHMDNLTVNGDTVIANPNFPGGALPMHRYWIHWDRTAPVSLPETALPNLRIGPNPTANHITISLPHTAFRWQLITGEGAHRAAGTEKNQAEIDLDGLAAGYYLLVVEANQGRRVERIVKIAP